MDSPFCPRCGTARTGAFRFCRSCGLDFDNPIDAPPATPSQAAATAARGAVPEPARLTTAPPGREPEGTGDRTWSTAERTVGALVVVVLLAGGYMFLTGGSGPGSSGTDPTPRPTARITPEPVITPAPADFDPIALKGKGARLVQFVTPVGSSSIAEVRYTGGGNFAIWAIDAGGSETDLLVNVIGKYTGTVLFDDLEGEHTVAFKVDAEGSWEITVKPVTSAPTWDPSAPLRGQGDSVRIVSPAPTGLTTLNMTYRGGGNFAVWSYSLDGLDLLANEIGDFSGQTLFPAGTFLLVVSAEDAWTLTTE